MKGHKLFANRLGAISGCYLATLGLVLSILASAGAMPLSAQSFDFPNFSSVDGLVLNGRAKQGNPVGPENSTVLRLMDGLGGTDGMGSAWYGQLVPVEEGFTTTFHFNINTCVGTCGDGMAFVIQNSTAGTAALGGGGGSIGYGPPTGIDHSLAIEFDTYFNPENADPNNNHVGVQSCGTAPNTPDHDTTCNLSLNSKLPITLTDAANHTVLITYVPGTLTARIDGKVITTTSVDLSTLLGLDSSGTAFVGFTAGAGGAGENADILDWSFSNGVSLSPASLNLGVEALGVVSPSQSSILFNATTETVNITSIGVTGNFLQGNTCGASLAPGATCAINIAFLPRSLGPQTGTLTVTDSASNSPQVVALTGTGTAVELSPRTLNFGSQTLGTTSQPQTITLTNKGKTPLDIYNIGVAGADFGDFNVEYTTCSASLGVNQSCLINVTFTPQATGSRSASVTIDDNAGGPDPQRVKLTGTGT